MKPAQRVTAIIEREADASWLFARSSILPAKVPPLRRLELT